MPANRREALKLAAAGAAGAIIATPTQAHGEAKLVSIVHVRSDKLLSPSLKVTYPKVDKPGRSYHVLYRVKVPELRVGDVLLATAELESTSEHPYAIAIASVVAIGDFKDDGEQAHARGRHVCNPAGSNVIDKAHHHLFFSRCGSLAITKQMAGLNAVFLVGYAASDARKVGDKVAIMDGYGHLSVILHRTNEA